MALNRFTALALFPLQDNAMVHTAQKTKEWLESRGI
jgi:hypothetical protein